MKYKVFHLGLLFSLLSFSLHAADNAASKPLDHSQAHKNLENIVRGVNNGGRWTSQQKAVARALKARQLGNNGEAEALQQKFTAEQQALFQQAYAQTNAPGLYQGAPDNPNYEDEGTEEPVGPATVQTREEALTQRFQAKHQKAADNLQRLTLQQKARFKAAAEHRAVVKERAAQGTSTEGAPQEALTPAQEAAQERETQAVIEQTRINNADRAAKVRQEKEERAHREAASLETIPAKVKRGSKHNGSTTVEWVDIKAAPTAPTPEQQAEQQAGFMQRLGLAQASNPSAPKTFNGPGENSGKVTIENPEQQPVAPERVSKLEWSESGKRFVVTELNIPEENRVVRYTKDGRLLRDAASTPEDTSHLVWKKTDDGWRQEEKEDGYVAPRTSKGKQFTTDRRALAQQWMKIHGVDAPTLVDSLSMVLKRDIDDASALQVFDIVSRSFEDIKALQRSVKERAESRRSVEETQAAINAAAALQEANLEHRKPFDQDGIKLAYARKKLASPKLTKEQLAEQLSRELEMTVKPDKALDAFFRLEQAMLKADEGTILYDAHTALENKEPRTQQELEAAIAEMEERKTAFDSREVIVGKDMTHDDLRVAFACTELGIQGTKQVDLVKVLNRDTGEKRDQKTKSLTHTPQDLAAELSRRVGQAVEPDAALTAYNELGELLSVIYDLPDAPEANADRKEYQTILTQLRDASRALRDQQPEGSLRHAYVDRQRGPVLAAIKNEQEQHDMSAGTWGDSLTAAGSMVSSWWGTK